MKDYTKRVAKFIEKHGDKEKAKSMENVAKNKLKFLGILTQDLNEFYKIIFLNFPLPPYDEIKSIIREFFAMKEREYLYFGTELFYKVKKEWKKTDIVFIESLILTNPAWDTIDDITAKLIGTYAKMYPNTAAEFIETWSNSKNPWLKIASIMYQRQYKSNTDREILEKNIVKNMNSGNEMVNKAIGYALRDYSKVDHEWVLEFVVQNSSELDKKAKQEAIKWIDKKGLIS